jgi:hypothetical protein
MGFPPKAPSGERATWLLRPRTHSHGAALAAPFARHVNSLFRPSQPQSGLFKLARLPNAGNCNCSDRRLRTRIRCSRVGLPPTAPSGETATLLLTAGTTRGNGGGREITPRRSPPARARLPCADYLVAIPNRQAAGRASRRRRPLSLEPPQAKRTRHQHAA